MLTCCFASSDRRFQARTSCDRNMPLYLDGHPVSRYVNKGNLAID